MLVLPTGTNGALLHELPERAGLAAHELGELVGGNLEVIATAGSDWLAYINEDGTRLGLRFNPQADAMCRTLGYPFGPGDYIKGTAVFMGRADDGINEADVPEHVLALARAAGLVVVQAPAATEAR